jgi:hypothetical protein
MPPAKLIDHAFEDLAQSLRILLEADYRANRGGLLLVDRAEAVGNIETALSSVLNAFHSLHDAIEKQLGAQPVDWYRTGPLAVILAVRNARHHNKANRIRSLYTYHTQEAKRPTEMEQYVLVDFPATEEGADTFDVYVSWADLNLLLSLPRDESRLGTATCEAIRSYLGSDRLKQYAAHFDQPESKVFINIVPLLVNAAGTIVPHIREHLSGASTESKFFAWHFASLEQANTEQPEVNCGPFVLPK